VILPEDSTYILDLPDNLYKQQKKRLKTNHKTLINDHYEIKHNPGSRTYVEIKLDQEDDNENYYEKDLKKIPKDTLVLTLSVATNPSQNKKTNTKRILFFRDRALKTPFEQNQDGSAKITIGDFLEKKTYEKEYSGTKAKTEDSYRLRLYMAADSIQGVRVRQGEYKFVDEHKLTITSEGALPKAIALSTDIKTENIDAIMRKELLDKINDRDLQGKGALLHKEFTMASMACLHKNGQKTAGQCYSNIGNDVMEEVWKDIFEHKDGEFVKNHNGEFVVQGSLNIDALIGKYFDTIKEQLKDRFKYMGGLNEVLKARVVERLSKYLTKSAIKPKKQLGDHTPSMGDGPPGFHAEIFAVNQVIDSHLPFMTIDEHDDSHRITVITKLLGKRGAPRGEDYTACGNCTDILSGLVRLPAGVNHKIQ